MDSEQGLLLHQWLCSRFLHCRSAHLAGAKPSEPFSFSSLPGAADCSLFAHVLETITGEQDTAETYGGPKLRLMHRLKAVLRLYHLDAADYLTSVYRRLESEGGKVDLAALLHLLAFLTSYEEKEGTVGPFDPFQDNVFLGKTLRVALAIYVRVLGQMGIYSKIAPDSSPFQPPYHRRSESSIQKRQRIDLEAEIEDLRTQNALLHRQLLACQDHSPSKTSPNTSSGSLYEAQREEFESNAREIEAREAQIVKYQREIARLQNEKSRLSDDNDVLSEKVADLVVLERKMQGWRDKAEASDALKGEIADLKAVLQVVQMEKAALGEKMLEIQLKSSRSEYLSKELASLEARYVENLRECVNLREELASKPSPAPLFTHISVREDSIDSSEVAELRNYVTLLEAEMATLRAELDAQSNASLQSAVAAAKGEMEWLRQAKDDWLTKYALLEGRCCRAEQEHEAERVASALALASAQDENSTLKGKLTAHQSEISKLWRTIAEERAICSNFKDFSEKLAQQITELKAKEVQLVAETSSKAKCQGALERLLIDLETRTLALQSNLPDLALEGLESEVEGLLHCLHYRSEVSTEADDCFHTPPSH